MKGHWRPLKDSLGSRLCVWLDFKLHATPAEPIPLPKPSDTLGLESLFVEPQYTRGP